MPPKKISARIDGELVSALEGQTILEATLASGKSIPTLCYLEGLKAVGACRLCMVEVSGVDRLLPACTTPLQDGMSVTTKSPKLSRYRPITVELLLVERNHICAVCVSNGHCELQTMAFQTGHHACAFRLQLSPADGGRVSPAIRAGPQPVHPVHPLRTSVRGSGGRARVGHHLPWHPCPPDSRTQPEVGRSDQLHEFRQVYPGVPDRCVVGKG